MFKEPLRSQFSHQTLFLDSSIVPCHGSVLPLSLVTFSFNQVLNLREFSLVSNKAHL